MTMTHGDAEFINIYRYFNQGEIWIPYDKPQLLITQMDARWRRNAARWLVRRAKHFELLYSLGEALLVCRPSSNIGDDAAEAMLDAIEQRTADPVAWIRSTPLYRALVTGPCCQGTGLADYAAVPCLDPQCPYPQPEVVPA